MLSYDLDKMLYTLPADKHSPEDIRAVIEKHPEVKFVSLVGIDIGGHDTDEKIPVEEFLGDIEKFLKNGVQTDGSSVVLPKIAKLNNAKVDITDVTVNCLWITISIIRPLYRSVRRYAHRIPSSLYTTILESRDRG